MNVPIDFDECDFPWNGHMTLVECDLSLKHVVT